MNHTYYLNFADTLLIPLHNASTNHWALPVLRKLEVIVTLMDSAPTSHVFDKELENIVDSACQAHGALETDDE